MVLKNGMSYFKENKRIGPKGMKITGGWFDGIHGVFFTFTNISIYNNKAF